jgi:hypothetical protein
MNGSLSVSKNYSHHHTFLNQKKLDYIEEVSLVLHLIHFSFFIFHFVCAFLTQVFWTSNNKCRILLKNLFKMLTSLLRSHRFLVSSVFQRTKYINPTLLSQSYYHPQVSFYFRNLSSNNKTWKKLLNSSKKHILPVVYYSTQTSSSQTGTNNTSKQIEDTTSQQAENTSSSESPPPSLPPELEAKRQFRTLFISILMSSQQKE